MKIALTYIRTQKWMSDDESIGVDNKIVPSRTKLQQLYNSIQQPPGTSKYLWCVTYSMRFKSVSQSTNQLIKSQ